jgi:hypothetical protein
VADEGDEPNDPPPDVSSHVKARQCGGGGSQMDTFPSVDAPWNASGFWCVGTMLVAAICPASAAAFGCGPVWEFADRNQVTQSVLAGTVESTGSSGPVSPTVVPYPPSTDLASPTASDADPGSTPWPPPELGRFRPSPEGPRRCAPSCWPAPPSPACGAFAPASVPATIL